MKATYGASVNDKVMNIQRELNSYYFGLLCPTLTIDLYEKTLRSWQDSNLQSSDP